MARYVLDTNIYIAADRETSWAEELDRFSSAHLPFIYLHGVVAQELLAGAIDQRREKLVEDSLIVPFERRGRVIAPSFAAWKSAGRVATRLVQRKLMSPGGFNRSFFNDCVLATSCRERGLTLITRSREDFDRIRKVQPFTYVEPWPP